MIPREDALATMERETFDVVVVGGGHRRGRGPRRGLPGVQRGPRGAQRLRRRHLEPLLQAGARRPALPPEFDLGLVSEALLERSLMVTSPLQVKPLPLLVPSFGASARTGYGVGLICTTL